MCLCRGVMMRGRGVSHVEALHQHLRGRIASRGPESRAYCAMHPKLGRHARSLPSKTGRVQMFVSFFARWLLRRLAMTLITALPVALEVLSWFR